MGNNTSESFTMGRNPFSAIWESRQDALIAVQIKSSSSLLMDSLYFTLSEYETQLRSNEKVVQVKFIPEEGKFQFEVKAIDDEEAKLIMMNLDNILSAFHGEAGDIETQHEVIRNDIGEAIEHRYIFSDSSGAEGRQYCFQRLKNSDSDGVDVTNSPSENESINETPSEADGIISDVHNPDLMHPIIPPFSPSNPVEPISSETSRSGMETESIPSTDSDVVPHTDPETSRSGVETETSQSGMQDEAVLPAGHQIFPPPTEAETSRSGMETEGIPQSILLTVPDIVPSTDSETSRSGMETEVVPHTDPETSRNEMDTEDNSQKEEKTEWKKIVIVVVSILVFLFITIGLIILIYYLYKRRKNMRQGKPVETNTPEVKTEVVNLKHHESKYKDIRNIPLPKKVSVEYSEAPPLAVNG